MATALPPTVLNWLHNVLRNNYHNVDRTFSDVAHTLERFPAFRLKTDVYTSPRGDSILLLNISGNLPISFRGATYAFPLSIWVPYEYPEALPMIFVVPTQDMAVRPGQHVSADGRVYHPYLANWNGNSSTIAEALLVLLTAFSAEPPLVARNASHASVTQSGNPASPNPPHLPPRSSLEHHGPPPLPQQTRPNASIDPPPPPRPPKNEQSGSSKYDRPAPLPQEAQGGNFSPRGPEFVNIDGPRFDPLRGRRSSLRASKTPDARQQVSTAWRADVAAASRPPSIQATPNLQGQMSGRLPHIPSQQPPVPAQYHGDRPSTMHYNQNHEQQRFQGRQQIYSQQLEHGRLDQKPKAHPPEDLLTSPFDTTMPLPSAKSAPPPIPPNPQKDAILSVLSKTLTKQIQDTHASNMSAISPLHAQQSALTSTLNDVNMEMSQLNDLESLLSNNEGILRKAMRDADKVLEDARSKKVPNIDEVLVAPTVVAGQLYQIVAEERAIEDCRAVLVKALDKGHIGSSVWAKQTRSLAREEFLKKALIDKISRGMGLMDERQW